MEIMDYIVDDCQYFERLKEKSICLYGAGAKGRQTLQLLREKGIMPKVFIDKDTQKCGKTYEGLNVISPEDAVKLYPENMILITTVWTSATEIEKFVKANWSEYVFCANPFKVENKFLEKSEIMGKKEQFLYNYGLLRDEKSRKILIEEINWKITGNSKPVTQFTEEDSILEWFRFDKIDWDKRYTCVDVGAYTGDTLVRFMMAVNGKYREIIAVEPDKTNRECMKKNMKELRLDDKIIYLEEGAWKEKAELKFYQAGGDVTYESSNFVESTANILPTQMGKRGITGVEVQLPVDTLDNMLENADKENLIIKIDVLGSEYETILGATQTISNHKPILMLEFATHSNHILDIIPLLYKLNAGYQFYLRQTLLSGNSRTVLYAV